jgi:branched-chain amino acid transport system permease protein
MAVGKEMINARLAWWGRAVGFSVGMGQLTTVGVVVAAIVAFGLSGDRYLIQVGATVGIYAMAALGLNFLVGMAGQFSFGHTAFLAIGAYSTAILTVRQGVSPLQAMLFGMALALLVSFLIGYPTLRLRGLYLGMATVAMSIASTGLATSWSELTGGFSGIAGIPALRLGGLILKGSGNLYWVAWILAGCWFIVFTRLINSRFGLALRTTALDQEMAQSLGINTHIYKVAAFCIAAVNAAMAGSLLAHLLTFVSPETVSFGVVVQMFMMLFIGGLGNNAGVILGAAVVIGLPQVLSFAKDYFDTIYGLLMIVILITRPRGLLAVDPQTRGWIERLIPAGLRRDK